MQSHSRIETVAFLICYFFSFYFFFLSLAVARKEWNICKVAFKTPKHILIHNLNSWKTNLSPLVTNHPRSVYFLTQWHFFPHVKVFFSLLVFIRLSLSNSNFVSLSLIVKKDKKVKHNWITISKEKKKTVSSVKSQVHQITRGNNNLLGVNGKEKEDSFKRSYTLTTVIQFALSFGTKGQNGIERKRKIKRRRQKRVNFAIRSLPHILFILNIESHVLEERICSLGQ